MTFLYYIVKATSIQHLQVEFSIRSVRAQINANDRVVVLTDAPTLYSHLSCVKAINVSENQIQEWEGQHRFFWRGKIMAIIYTAELFPLEDVVYLDGDTCLAGDIEEIRKLLHHGHPLMHKREGNPGLMQGKSLNMWNTIKGKTYAGITMTDDQEMWNAGVVGIPHSMLNKVPYQALKMCDEILDDHAEPIVVEQFSLSACLQNLATMNAATAIIHYWHNKKLWTQYAAKVISDITTHNLSVDEEKRYFKQMNLMRVNRWLKTRRILNKII